MHRRSQTSVDRPWRSRRQRTIPASLAAALLLVTVPALPAAAATGEASARAAHVGLDVDLIDLIELDGVSLDLADVEAGPGQTDTSDQSTLELPIVGDLLQVLAADEVNASASSTDEVAEASAELVDVGISLPLVGDVTGLLGLLDGLDLGIIDIGDLLDDLGLGDLGAGEVLHADLIRAEAICPADGAPTAHVDLPEQLTVLGSSVDLDVIAPNETITVPAAVGSARLTLLQETTTDATAAATALEALIDIDVLGVGSVNAQVTLAEADCSSPGSQDDDDPEALALCANVPRDVFEDVTLGSTHSETIDCIAAYDITIGKTPTTYDPAGTVTRGQMASYVMRLIRAATGEQYQVPGSTPMTDIAGNTHEDNIKLIIDLGIARGRTATTFEPNSIVTRGQIATFTKRAAEFVGYEFSDDATSPFTDIAGDVHEENIVALADAGMIRGTTSTTFSPRIGVTRAQQASFLIRAANGLDENELWSAPRFEEE